MGILYAYLSKLGLATFIVAVIGIGVITIKLKRRNRERMQQAFRQIFEEKEPPKPYQPQPKLFNPAPPPVPKPKEPEQPRYVPPDTQDLALAVVPFGEEFSEEMELLIALAKDHPEDIQLELNVPVTSSDIRQFEEKHGFTFTDELRALYQFADGFWLTSGHLEIYPLRMIENCLSFKYEWGDTRHLVEIGSMIGDGEMILLDLDTRKIVTNDHGEEDEYDTLTELLVYIIGLFVEGDVDDERVNGYVTYGTPE